MRLALGIFIQMRPCHAIHDASERVICPQDHENVKYLPGYLLPENLIAGRINDPCASQTLDEQPGVEKVLRLLEEPSPSF